METGVVLTGHAVRRAQLRGVLRRAIYWTALLGESKRAVGGAIRRTMTRKSSKRLLKLGLSPAEISRYVGTVLITKDIEPDERHVLTVRPTEKDGERRGGKYKPKYGNPRSRIASSERPVPIDE